jgi:hypothetical protein
MFPPGARRIRSAAWHENIALAPITPIHGGAVQYCVLPGRFGTGPWRRTSGNQCLDDVAISEEHDRAAAAVGQRVVGRKAELVKQGGA